MKSDQLPQVISLESMLFGAEDYKFEKMEIMDVESERSEITRPL